MKYISSKRDISELASDAYIGLRFRDTLREMVEMNSGSAYLGGQDFLPLFISSITRQFADHPKDKI